MPVLSLFMPVTRVIKQNRSWIVFAAVIFTASGIFSYFATASHAESVQIIDAEMEQLQALFKLILESNPVVASMIVFMLNFITLAQMLLLGGFAGISPLITLYLNGRILGILAVLAAAEGVPLLPMLLLGILPHGIFELAAFFICGALGLKFGYHCIAFPLPGKNRLQSFKYIWKEAVSVLPLVVLLLLVAALVEVMITPRLLGLVMEVQF